MTSSPPGEPLICGSAISGDVLITNTVGGKLSILVGNKLCDVISVCLCLWAAAPLSLYYPVTLLPSPLLIKVGCLLVWHSHSTPASSGVTSFHLKHDTVLCTGSEIAPQDSTGLWAHDHNLYTVGTNQPLTKLLQLQYCQNEIENKMRLN